MLLSGTAHLNTLNNRFLVSQHLKVVIINYHSPPVLLQRSISDIVLSIYDFLPKILKTSYAGSTFPISKQMLSQQ